jgi:CHAT domain-containing protein/Tfp pilus assembly protein PilF
LGQKISKFFFIILSPCFLAEIQTLTAKDKHEVICKFERILTEGTSLRQKGNFSDALSLFEKALKLARNAEDKKGEITCLMNLGVLFWNLGQPNESADQYAKALSLAQGRGQKDLEHECSGALKIYEAYSKGKKLRLAGRNKESITHFELAVNLARTIKSPEHELKCLRQLSLNYFRLEALKEFFSLNYQALKIARKLNHRQEVGRCLNNIGLFYWKSYSYSKALAHFDESLMMARKVQDDEEESISLNNIGIVYKDIGNYDKALQYLIKALNIDQKKEEDNGVLVELNNIGAIFRQRGEFSGNKNDFKTSLDYYLESLDKAGRVKNKKSEIETLNNIGLVYGTLGNFVSSLKYLSLAQDKAKEIGGLHELSNICINIGNVYLSLRNYEESKKYFRRGLELSLKVRENGSLWEAYFGLGQCFEIEQQYSSALACYKKAIDIIDFVRSQLSLDDYKAGFARDKLKVYESLLHLLIMLRAIESTSRYDEEIFQVVERTKARAFLEGLKERDDSLQRSASPGFRAERNDISKKITLTISELAQRSLAEDRRKTLLARLEKEEQDYLSFLNKIKSEKPARPRLSSLETISIDNIQNQLLDRKTAVLEFFLGEKESYVFLITKTDFILRSLPARMDIESSLRAYLKILSAWPTRKFHGVPAAKRLYRDLIYSFERFISPPLEHLIIVPDGVLYYLPFETLVRDEKGRHPKQQYLIEQYKISYAPSISSLVFLANKRIEKRNSKRLLAIGNPDYSLILSQAGKLNKAYGNALREIYLDNGFDFSLLPFTRREVLQISRYFPKDQVDIYLDAEAREEVIKRTKLNDYQIIHFACHGFQDEKLPFRSALVLSLDSDVEEDGFLQVREIYDLRLNADLVVLSACQTGRGKLENGEGILGLPRVFFYAGARSTISTLWKINDKSTSDLMRYFYRYLSEGNDKAQALRLAKIKMIRSKFSHPFFWAGFVLNGDFNSCSSSELLLPKRKVFERGFDHFAIN